MEEVYRNIKSAWKFIKYADEHASQGNKKFSSNGVRLASEYLLEAYEHLIQAVRYMPKYNRAVVEVIMELGDPMMYDYIYRFRPVYKFKNKEIEKKWNVQVNSFVKYSKKLIDYEELLKEYPYSSVLKDYKK